MSTSNARSRRSGSPMLLTLPAAMSSYQSRKRMASWTSISSPMTSSGISGAESALR